MKFYKLLIALALIMGLQMPAQATHIAGGDITYENIGQDSFIVTLRLIRDCAGITAPLSAVVNFNNTCGGFVTATLINQSNNDVSQICSIQIPNTTCNGGTIQGMEEHIYSGIVVLSGTCNSWNMSWESCCRNNSISNLVNPGSLSTYLSTQAFTMSFPTNSSPVFLASPAPKVYANKATQINLGAVDPDGDSLSYFMAPGYQNNTTLTPYTFPYTFTQPLPGANAVLDNKSGQLNFTPTSTGVYVVSVRVEEYDKLTGTIKGVVYRDFSVNVLAGTHQPAFAGTGMTNLGNGTITNGALNICTGDSLNFNISASDSDLIQSLTLRHNVYSILDSTAVVTTTGTNPMTINVQWVVPGGFSGNKFLWFLVEDNGCPVLGQASYAYEIKINDAVYGGEDQSICAGDSVQMNAIGGSSFVWSVINGPALNTNSSSTGYNATCSNCQNPIFFPAATTTYQLVSNLSGGCNIVDTVVINVGTNFSLSTTNDTTICGGEQLPLNVVATPGSGSLTYTWSPGSSLSSDTIMNPMATPTGNTTYEVTVSNGVCTKSGNVQVNISDYFPSGNFVSGDTIICSGGSTQLSGNLGNFPAITSCGLATDVYGKANTIVAGTGNGIHNSLTQSEIYERNSLGSRHQILFTAAELHALGFSKGKISDISFEIVSNVSQTSFTDLTIKMGCTSSSTLSNWESGLTQVFYSSSHIPSAGWDQLVFPTPYDWNGNSNLIIEVCHNNGFAQGSLTVRSYHTNVGTSRTIFEHSTVNNVCNGTGSTPSTSNARPNVRFGYYYGIDTNDYVYSWTPVATVSAPTNRIASVSPGANTTYQLVISNVGGGCSDTINTNVTVNTSQFDAGFSYDSLVCLNSGIQTLIPIKPGGIFTGTGVSANGVFNPAAAGVGTWPINYNIPTPTLCSNDSTVMITVQGLPDATFLEPEICTGSSSLQLTSTTAGGVWSGVQILDSTLGTFDPVGLAPGQYEVVYTLNSPCFNSDTGFVSVIEPYQFVLSQSTVSLCQGESVDLNQFVIFSSAPNQGANPYVTFSDPNSVVDPGGVFDASGVTPGNYVVNILVSDEVGACSSNNSIMVTVEEIDYAEIIDEPSYCISQSTAKIFVQPWLFGAGVSFTQRPLGNLSPTDTLNILPFGQNGEFTPSHAGLGAWEIEISYTNTNGCTGTTVDTIHVLNTPQTNVTNTGLELTATAGTGYIYQWLDCDNGNAPIAGATSATYVPGRKGRFAVEIKAGNCNVTSDCYETWPVGISETEKVNSISVYPNPVNELVNISLDRQENVIIQIIDNTGKIIKEVKTSELKTTISLQNQPSGVYLIKVVGSESQYSERIIKK